MRVISGSARRTMLVAPAGLQTRPTADRAKEGLFNILAPKVRGARFLDIFCGSGAVGIEALSRGAKEAVFVENNPAALTATTANLEKTRLSHLAEVLKISAEAAIMRLAREKRQFDIIFLDPPYGMEMHGLAELADILAPEGIVVAETENNDENATFPSATFQSLSITSTRAYGRAKFFFFQAKAGTM